MPEIGAEQKLCKTCGICCDGTLFRHATIKEGELLPPGLQDVYEEGERCFRLPCPHFDGICTIYHEGRPAVCGTYRCTLLENLTDGTVPFEEASQLVSKIRAQKARLDLLLSDYPGESVMDRYEEFQRQHAALKDTAEFRLQNRDLLMEWVVFIARRKLFKAV
jgi:hypothetical protein